MNFRSQIDKNKKLTIMVIFTYIFIMYCVGILADIAIFPIKDIDFKNNIIAFVMFHKPPYITCFIIILTLICILSIHFFGHKMMMSGMHYDEITDQETDFNRSQAFNTLKEMSISAGLRYVPKFYVMNSKELNAFASGWGESNACVAVTTGLIEKLNRAEIQSVVAHEVAHIIHGDSKLTMYVGILANVILTVTNLFANIFFILTARSSSKEANTARVLLLVLNLILPLVTRLLYLYLSRTREYMADAASVKLTGNDQSMISALLKISEENKNVKDTIEEESSGDHFRRVAYIYSRFDNVFSTHPKIEDRISAIDRHYYQNKEREINKRSS